MIEEIFRKYLEIKSINDLSEVQKPLSSYSLNLIEAKDFQLKLPGSLGCMLSHITLWENLEADIAVT